MMNGKFNRRLIDTTVETLIDPKAGAQVSRDSERALLLSGIDMLRKTLDSAVSDLDTLFAAIANGETDPMALTVEQAVDLITRERTLATRMIEELGREATKEKKRADDLFERAATASETLMKQEKEIAALRSTIDRTLAAPTITELNEEIAELRADRDEALSKIEHMDAVIDDLRLSLDSANRYGDQHRERLKEIESGGEFKKLDAEIGELREQIIHWRGEAVALAEQLASAKAERDACLGIVRLALKLVGVTHAGV